MEDDKLKELFDNYNPELSSGMRFMERVERNLDSVESLMTRNAAMRKRYRKAVFAAAIAGFVVGMIFTLFMPYIATWVVALMEMLPQNFLTEAVAENYRLAVWPLICATSLFIAVNTYEISLSRQKSHACF